MVNFQVVRMKNDWVSKKGTLPTLNPTGKIPNYKESFGHREGMKKKEHR